MNSHSNDDLLLDRFDVQLLDALQKNAQATNQELGTKAHLSASQISRRVGVAHVRSNIVFDRVKSTMQLP